MLARNLGSVHGGGVSFDEVHAAEKWLAAFGLPEPPVADVKDLKGQRVSLCAPQEDDETLRIFLFQAIGVVLYSDDQSGPRDVAEARCEDRLPGGQR